MKDEIIKFLTEIKEQDNRSTASPIYFVIRTATYVPTDKDYGYDKITYYDNDDCREWESKEAFEAEMTEEGLDEEEIEHKFSKFSECAAKLIWEEKGMFLTETDAKHHLKANNYHYSQDAHLYVKHAWRAPDLAEFFKNLNEYFGV